VNAFDNKVVTPTAAELIQRATDLIPVLRERSARCEEMRRVLPETIDDLVRNGLVRIAQPKRFGGFGLGPDVVAEVAMQIGRGCGASGWMASQWPGHQFIVGMFPLQAQEEYWANSPDTLSSTASAMTEGSIEPVADGFRVKGARIRFSSGVDASEWIIMMTPVAMCLVPRADYVVVDDWFVSGLKGSGSKSVFIEDAFVPIHRSLTPEAMFGGNTAGTELYADPYYQGIPYPIWTSPMLAAAVVGMAQGVIDLFDARVMKRMSQQTMGPAIEQPGNQLRFAEACAEVDAARAIIRNTLQEVREWGTRGGGIAMVDRARSRRDTTYAIKLCVQATDRLYESGDASAIYDSSPSQRMVRDVHAGALQLSLTWDEPAIQYSRVRWGLPPQTRLI
jgi:3-hydroxy-9,10-secoandrosta-1,3,5(10)-triene-9,17-dione monooxygenase